MSVDTEFRSFGKIARLSRDIVITEKLDGTNAQVLIVPRTDDGTLVVNPWTAITKEYTIHVGSRNRWITPRDDNYGFAQWVSENANELAKLGPGRHFGEWWGQGIQRGYGLKEKRFSLFNTGKWYDPAVDTIGGTEETGSGVRKLCPSCCSVVPIIYSGPFLTEEVDRAIEFLTRYGSYAGRPFQDPEGIIIYHTASGHYYKKTIKDDEKGKTQ